MFEPFPAAAVFENLDMAGQIGVDVVEGVVDGVAHAGLRREMDHAPDIRSVVERGRERTAVGEINPVKGEPVTTLEAVEPGLFQAGAVISADIVDADHAFAAVKQTKRRIAADEAGDSGNKDRHVSTAPLAAGGRTMY